MTPRKLAKLKIELEGLRASPQKAAALQSLAKRLGRTLNTNRGKHPIWESAFGHLYPLPIPDHGGKDIPTGTKNRILDQLEEDIAAWDETLPEESENDTEH